MKKLLTFSTLSIFLFFFATDIFSQSFFTGSIGVTQSNGGRTRVFSDNLTTRQIERASVLVGVSKSQVFDYNEDQDVSIPAATIATPLSSDFEITSTINNSYSTLPPNVEASLNIYGWTNEAYLIIKVKILNKETSAINAVVGLELIPRINGTYENDTLQWNASSKSLLIHKDAAVAVKFLSSAQKSLRLVEWTDPYANDSLYYTWLTSGSFDAELIANSVGDGAVAVLGQDPINIAAGGTVEYYIGVAYGSNSTTCLNNIALCQSKYNQVLPVELTSFTALSQNSKVVLNWSTASELNNNGFEIQRKSRNSDFVTLGFVKGSGTSSEQKQYSYSDSKLADGNYSYRLKQVDFNGQFEYSNTVEVDVRSLNDFSLEQNYPNPFNPSTKIAYILKEKTNAKVVVMNAIGEEVAVLVNEEQEAGLQQLDFNASNLPSGIYFYTLQAGNFTETKKMILLK